MKQKMTFTSREKNQFKLFKESLTTWLHLKACVLLMCYCIANHPKCNGAKWQLFYYVHGFCGAGTWKGHIRVNMSLYRMLEASVYKTNLQLVAAVI